MNWRSTEEEYFSYYLDELKERDFVKEWYYESSTFTLSDGVSFNSSVISQAKSITSDFTIKWNLDNNPFISTCSTSLKKAKKQDVKKAIFLVYSKDCTNEDMSYIEIKSPFEKSVSSSYSFPYRQSWLLQKEDIFIQKVIPRGNNLFHFTFTPKKVQGLEVYSIKSKKGQSKIKWSVRNLDEYLNLINHVDNY